MCDELTEFRVTMLVVTAQNRIKELGEHLAAATQRAKAAEAKLAAVPDYAAYYAAAWEAFEADSDGPEPLDFAEWLAQRASSQRSE